MISRAREPVYRLTRDIHSLDVRLLARHGRFSGDEWSGSVRWNLLGAPPRFTPFRSTSNELALDVRATSQESSQGLVRVGISWSACALGGRRPWFLCPRCGRRCAVLYLPAGSIECRVCGELRYQSQREARYWRRLRRATTLRARLGVDDWLSSTSAARTEPRRPRGMWRRTFHRLRAKAVALEVGAGASSCLLLEAIRRRAKEGRRHSRPGGQRDAGKTGGAASPWRTDRLDETD